MTWRDQPRGKDGRWVKRPGAVVVVTGVLAAGVAYGPLGASGGGGAVSVEASLGKAVRAKLDRGKRSAAKGRRDVTWRRLDLRRISQRLRRGAQCAANSYGEVQQFLARTPCRSLDRMLFVLDDASGNRIVVSVSWVGMATSRSARQLRDLADVHGTGNISPLPGPLVGAGDIGWTGHNYDSRRSGRSVTIAEVEPLRGSPPAEYLDAVADVVAEFPRP
ncbi:hypothetical protein [Prauserella muralis]|uniref:Uncharacterized protein n=1 Tax=Prauserella muralis TaxID=588067 RepID=A0A2V4B1K0_9PSEU|nr:hypothetical protein [Prauserella muralis]PXY27923.1 hypothetical protein BAY60_16345 [Prauserella muralis]TWE22295.1 hypothetical protein FHX69_3532 [Prauserella muralis]